jgi:hypothetical protein
MESTEMLRHVALVKTDVSEELSASIIRVTRIGDLGTTLSVIRNRSTLRRNTIRIVFLRRVLRLLVTDNVVSSSPILATLMLEVMDSAEMSVSTRAKRPNIPEDGILYSHCCEHLSCANIPWPRNL